ncbi:PREDICTED: perlucin-like protein [Branchiostoma belcheri]|uniref:Perlucin-like protein n=1 Tax=Branchiostoma belcheri TaxID=7741 RepID=A0A6P4ZAK0_BRABE|nr:PREDICTED: perlucin-like protein [Branchiostoma belcheri]
MRDKVHWSEAKSRCANHGAILAAIKDAGENNFIKGLIKNAPEGKYPLVWLGLFKPTGQWMWTDRSRVGYSNWAPGEPNHRLIIKEDCGSMYFKTGKNWFGGRTRYQGQWNNAKCGHHYPYVCEKPM